VSRLKASWQPTPAFVRAVGFVTFVLLLAIVTGRPDVAVLGAPIALATAIALSRRPSVLPEVALDVEPRTYGEGSEIPLRIRVTNTGDVEHQMVVVRLARSRWLAIGDSALPALLPVAAGEVVDIDVPGMTAARWGRQRVGPAQAHAVAADGLLISRLVTTTDQGVPVYPIADAFQARAPIPRAGGIAGTHRSRRPGEGGEMAGVRAFAPGDRLRRIDWRVTLRTGQPHVVATLSERDARVLILIDVMQEAGVPGTIADPPSALDTSVRAAAAITNHYTHRGDRVGLLEHGPGARYLRPGSGHRHYLAALEWLLEIRAARGAEVSADVNDQRIPPRSLLVVLTPMVSSQAATMLAHFARSGRSVVAIDTMPPHILASFDAPAPIRPAAAPWIREGGFIQAAAQLWRYERANAIMQLREHGVPVVPWTGPGTIDDVLYAMSRVPGR
jgi:uncharacterized protein (DUF58 family)